MSTLAWGLADDITPANQSEAKPGFWSRFIEPRQARANRAICAHFSAMGDEHLTELGFSADDIRALRAGELRLPQTAQRG